MVAKNEYQLIDCGDQLKLERFGEITLVRPSSQSVWRRRDPSVWRADATFERDKRGTGRWIEHVRIPPSWEMQFADVTWTLRVNEHGNVGIFPEQAPAWRWIDECVRQHDGECRVLNLFGYTGGSTLAAARAGAKVVHLDASKTSVAAARENAERSGLGDRPIRWITDDAVKFVKREVRRNRSYHGIVLDPPTYGRGTGGEVWRIEEGVRDLLDDCRKILADNAAFVLFTSHSPGFTPLALENLIESPDGTKVESGEMTIDEEGGRPLPSGAFARWSRR